MSPGHAFAGYLSLSALLLCQMINHPRKRTLLAIGLRAAGEDGWFGVSQSSAHPPAMSKANLMAGVRMRTRSQRL